MSEKIYFFPQFKMHNDWENDDELQFGLINSD